MRLVCNYYVRQLILWLLKRRFEEIDDGGKDGLDYDSSIPPVDNDGVMEP